MPIDFKAINKDREKIAKKSSPNQSNRSAAEMYTYTGGMLQEAVPDIQVPLDRIDEREVNEFAEIDNSSLKESIKNYGIIHPIAVIRNGNRFKLISGHRRFHAMKELHEEFPDNHDYNAISATVYEVVEKDDPRLQVSNKYITDTEEKGMYQDANFEVRQISFEDAIAHIDFLLKKIDDNEDLKNKAIEKVKEINGGAIRDTSKVNRAKLLSDVLTNDLHYPGFSYTTVSRILAIKSHPDGKQMLKKISNKEISIKKAFYELYPASKKPKENGPKNIKVKKPNLKSLYANITETYDGINSFGITLNDLSDINKVLESTDALRKKLNQLKVALEESKQDRK